MSKNQIEAIKEYRDVAPGIVRCDVREEGASNSLREIEGLFNILAADFRGVTKADVKIISYDDLAHKGQIGLSFTTDQKPPADYVLKNRFSTPS